MMPVAGHDLGEHDDTTFRMRWIYAEALYRDADAVLDDLHEAMTTLEDTERTARRVLGGAQPGHGGDRNIPARSAVQASCAE
jgi:hypothetical protein